jgi:hypothetical protein
MVPDRVADHQILARSDWPAKEVKKRFLQLEQCLCKAQAEDRGEGRTQKFRGCVLKPRRPLIKLCHSLSP